MSIHSTLGQPAQNGILTGYLDALSLVERQAFDLALVDLNLPDGDGFALLRRLSQTRPETLGIVTTIMSSDAAIVAALSAGASGYLLKSDPPEMFEPNEAVVLEGAFVGDGTDTFRSDLMIVKHDENYTSENEDRLREAEEGGQVPVADGGGSTG